MRKLFVTILLLAVVGGISAQNVGDRGGRTAATEYVSVVITFNEERCPADSLKAYGVVLQKDEGFFASALVPANRYAAFCASKLVASVQPSTRVYLNPTALTESPASAKAAAETSTAARPAHPVTPRQVSEEAANDAAADRPAVHRTRRGQENVRRHLIPEQDIRDDEAEGAYVGVILGSSSNHVRPFSTPLGGNWYSRRGFSLSIPAGYQFCEWFGIRSGLTLLSKSYATDLVLNQQAYGTTYRDLYLQLPVMADFSVGSEAVRLHGMVGGYAAWWMSQYRNGLLSFPANSYYWGTTYAFNSDLDSRIDAGIACGLALSIRVTAGWQLLFEGNYYHSLTSIMKSPYNAKNRTWTFGFGFSHQF